MLEAPSIADTTMDLALPLGNMPRTAARELPGPHSDVVSFESDMIGDLFRALYRGDFVALWKFTFDDLEEGAAARQSCLEAARPSVYFAVLYWWMLRRFPSRKHTPSRPSAWPSTHDCGDASRKWRATLLPSVVCGWICGHENGTLHAVRRSCGSLVAATAA